MAALDFPTSPTNGQTYTANGKTWRWNGESWVNDSSGYTGSQGVIGYTGSQGWTGSQGYTGSQGVIGFTGSRGFTGSQGVIGFTGSQGIIGYTGSRAFTGSQGVIGYTGSQGIAGPGDTINATNDTTTNSSFYPVFVAAAGSDQTATVSTTKLYFNPSTGQLNATEFNSLSDAAFKDNLEADINSLQIIERLTPYAFRWTDSGQLSYGLIAQELEEIMPELVREDDRGVKSISYIPLIALLIDAIKKLNEEHKR